MNLEKDIFFYYKKNLKKKKYLKNLNQKIYFLNLFFNLNDVEDDIVFIFYDLFFFDKSEKWLLIKPYNYSFFFRFKETKKWLFLRLINNANKHYCEKKNKNIKKIIIWENWNINNSNLIKEFIIGLYKFKKEYFLFTFKQYYKFYLKKFNYCYYYYNNNLFFFKYLNYYINLPYNKNFLYYFYLKIDYFFNIFKKNNINFLQFKCQYIYYPIYIWPELSNYFFKAKKRRIRKLASFIFYYKKKKLFLYIIKEKHKIKNILFYKFFLKCMRLVRAVKVLKKKVYKKRLRRRKNEKKIILRKKKKRRKKRTNKQILFDFLRKYRFEKKISLNISYKDFFNKRNIDRFFLFKFKNFFIKKFFIKKFFICKDKFFFDLDSTFVFYLPVRRFYPRYLSFLTDPLSDLWRPPFIRGNNNKIDQTNVVLVNRLYKSKNYNTISIQNIHKFLIKNSLLIKKKNKNIVIFHNILTLIRFFKEKNFFLKNLDFIFNVYFWLIIFFYKLKKSKIFLIKNIINYTSFLKMIKILYNNKFNWFNLNNFEINIHIITITNLILKLKCNLHYLLEEFCLYFFFRIFNNNVINKENLQLKINKLSLIPDIQYIFKGKLSVENNYLYCLTLIKKEVNDSFFFKVIKNFFFNCDLSILFIKKNIKLYWKLLDLTYSNFDYYINNLINKFNLTTSFYYVRYKNILLICFNDKSFFQFLLKRFILLFLYYFLNLYFFFCMIYNLIQHKIEFFNYVIYKKEKNLKFKSSIIFFIKLFFFYNFLQKENTKLVIKPANYLLNLSLIRIFNYFFNIWNEIYYSLKFLKNDNLKIFNKIIYKACFLTMFLKLKKKNKNIKFNKFKKIFKFKYNNNKYYIKNKKLTFYLLNYTDINLKIFLNKHFKKKLK